ncbi:hypothetical protein OESDEN_09877 [Oesophagostomum dentatum]|uniref:SCP domain-containing protein n=1 Tax=Oesophagostomum dentatum TaxID=61180 RepID=A0A0B1T4F5_OESDE|nr:hypothetical protein OESDEN_09877 [Oesophagostomum dentatum]
MKGPNPQLSAVVFSHLTTRTFCRSARNSSIPLNGCIIIALMVLIVLPNELNAGPSCELLEEAELVVTAAHNKLRREAAQKSLDKKKYGPLKGSKSLFKLTYDCEHEDLAEGLINQDCTHNPLNDQGKAENFLSMNVPNDPTSDGTELGSRLKSAVDTWANIPSPLDADAIYRDSSVASFANVRFYYR